MNDVFRSIPAYAFFNSACEFSVIKYNGKAKNIFYTFAPPHPHLHKIAHIWKLKNKINFYRYENFFERYFNLHLRFFSFWGIFAFSQAEFPLGLYLLVSAIILLCLRAIVIASYTIKERKLIDAFTSIAELGNDSAMYDLYVYYLTNNLLALNPEKLATYWLNQAAKAGNEEAKKRLEEMNSSQEEGDCKQE